MEMETREEREEKGAANIEESMLFYVFSYESVRSAQKFLRERGAANPGHEWLQKIAAIYVRCELAKHYYSSVTKSNISPKEPFYLGLGCKPNPELARPSIV